MHNAKTSLFSYRERKRLQRPIQYKHEAFCKTSRIAHQSCETFTGSIFLLTVNVTSNGGSSIKKCAQ